MFEKYIDAVLKTGRVLCIVIIMLCSVLLIATTAHAETLPAGSVAPQLISGTSSKSACTKASPEMRVHGGGASVGMYFGSNKFYVNKANATRGNLTAPYLTIGYNEGIETSYTCQGYGGHLYKMPAKIGKIWPVASLHTVTHNSDVFDAGYDIWFSKSGETSYSAMTHDKNTTEIMVITSHRGIFSSVHSFPVKIDGMSWGVTTGTNHGWRVLNFISSNTHVGNVTVSKLYLSAFASWAISHHYLNKSNNWTGLDAGFEIAAGNDEAVAGYAVTGVPYSR